MPVVPQVQVVLLVQLVLVVLPQTQVPQGERDQRVQLDLQGYKVLLVLQ